jgi:hypothetical protein
MPVGCGDLEGVGNTLVRDDEDAALDMNFIDMTPAY